MTLIIRCIAASFAAWLFAVTAQADVLIGVAGPMSGQNASFGLQMKAGAEAAADAINAAGGLNGEQLSVIPGDDQCDVKLAGAVANQFAALDVRLVVGHFCSNAATAAASIYAKRGLVMISPSASHPKLTEQEFATTLRLAPRDDSQGAIAADRIFKDNPQAVVAVVEDGTAASKALVAKFSSVRGPALVVTIKPGERNLTSAIQKLRAGNPTAIYFACSGSDAGGIAASYEGAGYLVKLYGSDALLNEAFFERAGPASEGALATFPSDPQNEPGAQSVVAAMQARGLTADGTALTAYAAVQAFIAAAKDNPQADANAIVSRLKSGTKFRTILNDITFDGKGDALPQRYDWFRWSNGNFARADKE